MSADVDKLRADIAYWRKRAEVAESRLAAMNAERIADDDAAHAKRDAFKTPMALRDWREGQER